MPTTRAKKRRSQILKKISVEEVQINSENNIKSRPRRNRKEPKLSKQDEALKNAFADKTYQLQKIAQSLETSAIPENLICREEQFEQLYNFCYDGISSESSAVIYVAGVPGTGKTATMRKVIQSLDDLVELGKLKEFDTAHVNAMTLASPKNVFVAIYKELFLEEDDENQNQNNTQHPTQPNQCRRKLTEYFTTKTNNSKVTLLFIDELDLLQTKTQDVLYNIFDWPQKRNSKLLIVSIANTLDLPERLDSNRVASRIGHARILFKPYNRKQLVKVVKARLEDIAEVYRKENPRKNDPLALIELFKGDAIEFIARKITSVTGDARRMLDACRLATELLIEELEESYEKEPENLPKSPQITVQKALKAVDQLFGGGAQSSIANKLIKSLTKIEKIILKIIVAHLKANGADTVAVGEVNRLAINHFHAEDMRGIDGKSNLTKSSVSNSLYKLVVGGLIDVDNFRYGPLGKIRVLLRCDDILFALTE